MRRRREEAKRRILDAMHLSASRWNDGLELLRTTGLRAGRLYPALDQLEADGMVEATWADLEPGRKHRRRLYRIRYATGGPVPAGRPYLVREGDCIVPAPGRLGDTP